MFRNIVSSVALSALVAMAAGHLSTATAAVPLQSSSRSTSKPVSTAIVNINTGSLTELQTLPGVGAKMAERIVDYRQKNGPFKKAEELMNIRGIGEKNFLKIKPQISVTTAASKGERPAGASN